MPRRHKDTKFRKIFKLSHYLVLTCKDTGILFLILLTQIHFTALASSDGCAIQILICNLGVSVRFDIYRTHSAKSLREKTAVNLRLQHFKAFRQQKK